MVGYKHEQVRLEVARQGYGLDKLVNDKSWVVRAVVVQQGYSLDTLIHDSSAGKSGSQARLRTRCLNP